MDFTKGYTNRSNANRFATKTAKLAKGTFNIIPRDGKFYVARIETLTPVTVAPAPTVETPAAKPAKPAKKTTKKVAKPARKGGSLANVPMLHQSEIKRPCKTVWAIADSMKGAKRADIIAACVAKGIAFYTARTQYQQYKAAQARSVKK
jgi:hypothetical protein